MSAAEFSSLVQHSGGLVQWSPDGGLLAVAKGNKLIIRDPDRDCEIVAVFTCNDRVEAIEWSSDSAYVLTAMLTRALVQVWAVDDPDWSCRINEGLAGMAHAFWAPDARHVLTVADFGMHLTVWSLLDRTTTLIKHPKPGTGAMCNTMAFSADGARFAVAHRRGCKDAVSVFCARSWELVRCFTVQSRDLASLWWSPDGKVLCVQDSELEYKVLFYDAGGSDAARGGGRCGALLASYSAYEHALGVKNVAWAPAGQLVAIGSYDGRIRLLNNSTWRCAVDFAHDAACRPSVCTFVEVPDTSDRAKTAARRAEKTIREAEAGAISEKDDAGDISFVPHEGVPELRVVPADTSKPSPRLGVGLISWSADGRFLASRDDTMPHAIWIWDMERLVLATVIAFIGTVRSARFDKVNCRLAVCTGGPRVYFWTEQGISWTDVPSAKPFEVKALRWRPDGDGVVLVGKGVLTNAIACRAPIASPLFAYSPASTCNAHLTPPVRLLAQMRCACAIRTESANELEFPAGSLREDHPEVESGDSDLLQIGTARVRTGGARFRHSSEGPKEAAA